MVRGRVAKNILKACGGSPGLLIPALRRQRHADSMSLRPIWPTKPVPGQSGLLHRETLSGKKKIKYKKKKLLISRNQTKAAS